MSTTAATSSTSSSMLQAATGVSANGSSKAGGSNAMGKDAFLKLLVTQLKNQDPMSPTDNTQFIAQLAQFSGLESSQNIQADLDKMIQSQPMFQASNIMGRTVSTTDPNTGEVHNGKVDSMKFTSTQTTISIGGKDVPLSYVTSIE